MSADGLELAARHTDDGGTSPKDAETQPFMSGSRANTEGRMNPGDEPALTNLIEENGLVDAPNSIGGHAKQAIQSHVMGHRSSSDAGPPESHQDGKQDRDVAGSSADKSLLGGDAATRPWYTSRQVLLTLAGYGMVSHMPFTDTCPGCFAKAGPQICSLHDGGLNHYLVSSNRTEWLAAHSCIRAAVPSLN